MQTDTLLGGVYVNQIFSLNEMLASLNGSFWCTFGVYCILFWQG